MDNINDFLTTVVFPALLTIITTVISLVAAIGERRRGKKDKAEEEKEAQEMKLATVKTCVNAIEQTRQDIHGEEKLAACLEGAKEMLAIKGIEASEFELKMLIEAELAERNKVFDIPPTFSWPNGDDFYALFGDEQTEDECAGGACPIYMDPENVNEVD